MLGLMEGAVKTAAEADAASGPACADQSRTRWRVLLIAGGVFSALSLAAAIASQGFLEADACTHYLYSRFCFRELHLLTNVWGRPFCTALYAIPAVLGGRLAVRATSLLLALAIAWLTWRVARAQGYRRPELAFIFVLGQPLVFLHSFSGLTELPFALLVAGALLAYQRQWWLVLSVTVAVMPAARPEGFGFLLLCAASLVMHGRWRFLPLLPMGLLLWSVIGWAQFGMAGPWYVKSWSWLYENWPYAQTSTYASGHLLHFVAALPAIVSPLVFPAVIVGIGRSLGGLRLWAMSHRQRVQWLIAATALMILSVHSLLYWQGKMASNGELRYLLVVAPMWALLAAYGSEWLAQRLEWRRPVTFAAVAVLVPICFNFVYRVLPLQLTPESARSREVAQWYLQSRYVADYPRILATARDVYYFLDLSPTDPQRSAYWTEHTLADAQDNRTRGIVLVWDPVYGLHNANDELRMTLQQILDAGWIPVKVFSDAPPAGKHTRLSELARRIQNDKLQDWIVFLSPYDAESRPTRAEISVQLRE